MYARQHTRDENSARRVVVIDAAFVCRSSENKALVRESYCVLNAKSAGPLEFATFLDDLLRQCTFLLNSSNAAAMRPPTSF